MYALGKSKNTLDISRMFFFAHFPNRVPNVPDMNLLGQDYLICCIITMYVC